MKKILFMILALVLLSSAAAFAAGSCTETVTPYKDGDWMITLTCTADSSNGSFPAISINNRGQTIDGYVYMVVTNPGTTAPTDDYDITITDADGIDIMGGTLLNRDTANSEEAIPKIGNVYGSRRVNGALTVNITNNSVNSAGIVIKIFGYRAP